eukprot:m.1105282 g.1105282  ORF g.1105282 m.1105282 type:complete len:581 (-) comp24337_c0_seq2:1654-3396(-)
MKRLFTSIPLKLAITNVFHPQHLKALFENMLGHTSYAVSELGGGASTSTAVAVVGSLDVSAGADAFESEACSLDVPDAGLALCPGCSSYALGTAVWAADGVVVTAGAVAGFVSLVVSAVAVVGVPLPVPAAAASGAVVSCRVSCAIEAFPSGVFGADVTADVSRVPADSALTEDAPVSVGTAGLSAASLTPAAVVSAGDPALLLVASAVGTVEATPSLLALFVGAVTVGTCASGASLLRAVLRGSRRWRCGFAPPFRSRPRLPSPPSPRRSLALLLLGVLLSELLTTAVVPSLLLVVVVGDWDWGWGGCALGFAVDLFLIDTATGVVSVAGAEPSAVGASPPDGLVAASTVVPSPAGAVWLPRLVPPVLRLFFPRTALVAGLPSLDLASPGTTSGGAASDPRVAATVRRGLFFCFRCAEYRFLVKVLSLPSSPSPCASLGAAWAGSMVDSPDVFFDIPRAFLAAWRVVDRRLVSSRGVAFLAAIAARTSLPPAVPSVVSCFARCSARTSAPSPPSVPARSLGTVPLRLRTLDVSAATATSSVAAALKRGPRRGDNMRGTFLEVTDRVDLVVSPLTCRTSM